MKVLSPGLANMISDELGLSHIKNVFSIAYKIKLQ